ncbi:MAG: hypothetical protein RL264_1104 [Bacteroidota bacterium]
MKWFSFILCFLLLTSCIDIFDDLTIHADGSGTLKYNINLSSSKVRINSILALDSIDGKKVPSLDEVKVKVQQFIKIMDSQPGISNVKIEENYTDFILKFQCDFNSVNQLQEAIKNTVNYITKEKHQQLETNWLTWDGTKLTRSIPDFTMSKMKEVKESDIEKLKTSVYTSVTRFDKTIEKCDNPNAQLNKTRQAVMLKTDCNSLRLKPTLLENVIYVSGKN